MSKENDRSRTENPDQSDGIGVQSLSRRSFLRAGATAMPVVLTLQSGEALARTSNLIAAAPSATDASDNVLCLDTTYATPLENGKYDLGSGGGAYMPLRNDVSYHPLVSGGRSSDMGVTARQACDAGGGFEFKDGGWCRVNLPQNNIVVSSVALNSVSTRITITDNSNLNIIC